MFSPLVPPTICVADVHFAESSLLEGIIRQPEASLEGLCGAWKRNELWLGLRSIL